MKTKPIEISWREGADRHHKTSAKVAYKELERIKKAAGGDLVPSHVVDASRPSSAPLHQEFQWDDVSAAERWREEQARGIIRDVRVVYDQAPSIVTRAYQVVNTTAHPNKEGDKPRAVKVYRTTEEILADPGARADLLMQAMRDAQAFRKRYAGLQELWQIFASMDDFLKGVEL